MPSTATPACPTLRCCAILERQSSRPPAKFGGGGGGGRKGDWLAQAAGTCRAARRRCSAACLPLASHAAPNGLGCSGAPLGVTGQLARTLAACADPLRSTVQSSRRGGAVQPGREGRRQAAGGPAGGRRAGQEAVLTLVVQVDALQGVARQLVEEVVLDVRRLRGGQGHLRAAQGDTRGAVRGASECRRWRARCGTPVAAPPCACLLPRPYLPAPATRTARRSLRRGQPTASTRQSPPGTRPAPPFPSRRLLPRTSGALHPANYALTCSCSASPSASTRPARLQRAQHPPPRAPPHVLLLRLLLQRHLVELLQGLLEIELLLRQRYD